MQSSAEVVGPLVEALASLGSIDVEALDDRAVRDSLLALYNCANRLDAVIARFAGVFDDRNLSRADACRTTKQWLEAFLRLSGPAATARMRAVDVTRLLPTLADAFEQGAVTAEHVDLIGRTAEDTDDEVVEEAEAVLVPIARDYEPATLREVCHRLRDEALRDKKTPPDRQWLRRKLTVTPVGDLWHLRALLDAETGALLHAALDAFMTAPAPDDERSPGQRRHDAFADVLGAVLRDGRAPAAAGIRPHIGLLMPVRRYVDLHDHSPADHLTADHSPADRDPGPQSPGAPDTDPDNGPAVMDGWGPIPDDLAARLSCDATLQQLWLHPDNGLPLKLGRAYRNTPPALRRALAARDPHCRWPGCTSPANWCDSHHLREWIRDNGETDVDNLVLLCRYHHVCVHERRWGLHRDSATGCITVTRPDGTPYELGPSQPRRDGHRYWGGGGGGPPPG